MSQTSFTVPTAYQNVTGSITTPENSVAQDNAYAVYNDSNSYLQVDTFGFSIPSNAIITGIEVEVQAKATTPSGFPQVDISLSSDDGDSTTAEVSTDTLTASEQTFYVGGMGSLWGRSWTPDDFDDGNFAVEIGCFLASAVSVDVDGIRVRVYYSLPTSFIRTWDLGEWFYGGGSTRHPTTASTTAVDTQSRLIAFNKADFDSDSAEVYFEVLGRNSSAVSVSFELYDVTNAAIRSTITTSSGSVTRIRSFDLWSSLASGNNEYTVRWYVTSGTGYIYAARLVIKQDDSSTFTKTAGNIFMTDYNTIFASDYQGEGNQNFEPKFTYDSTKWADTNFYLEATMVSSDASGTAYCDLYDETSSSQVSGSERTVTGTTVTRSRSSALTLTDGHVYRVRVKSPSYTSYIHHAFLVALTSAGASVTKFSDYTETWGEDDSTFGGSGTEHTNNTYYIPDAYNGGTFAWFLNMTGKNPAGSDTGTFSLRNDTAGGQIADTSWTANAYSVQIDTSITMPTTSSTLDSWTSATGSGQVNLLGGWYGYYALLGVAFETYTADGIVKATASASFTADGIIKVTTATSFTADGIVIEPIGYIKTDYWSVTQIGVTVYEETITADGIIKETLIKDYTADGVVLVKGTQTITADGIVRDIFIETYTVDGIIRDTFVEIVTADAVILASFIETITSDGVVLAISTQTHTGDGIIRETFTETTAADAIIFEVKISTHTADGIVKEIFAETHTTDGIIRQTLVATHTANGVIREALIQSYTVDAVILVAGVATITADGVIRETSVSSVTADGVILQILVETITADAIVLEISAKTTTADGIVFETLVETITADAIVFETSVGITTADGIIFATLTQSHTADGIIFGISTETVTVDAIIQESFVATHTADAIVRETFVETITLDAVIKGILVETITVDGIVFATYLHTYTVDALIQGPGEYLTFVDGIIKETFVETITADALVINVFVATYTVDGIVQEIFVETHTADAIIRETFVVTPTADGIVFETRTTTFTADAIIRETFVVTVTGDGIVKETPVVIITLDGIVQETLIQVHTADGVVQETLIQTNTADGIVQEVFIPTHTLDGIIKETFVITITLDGIVKEILIQTHTADGIIEVEGLATVTIDAIILKTQVLSTVTADGLINEISSKTYTIDGIIQGATLVAHTADGILQETLVEIITADGEVTDVYIASHTADGRLIDTSNYTKEAATSLPTDTADLSVGYTTQEYSDVGVSDDIRVSNLGTGKYLIHQYKNRGVASTNNIQVEWEGRSDFAPSLGPVYLQIYNYDLSTWETLDNDSTTGANVDFSLNALITSSQSDYYDPDLWVVCRVYQYSG